jgi:two-component system chemotaxis response regulator CheY
MKVMMVDDSNTMRRILINQLKASGISDIIEASNGEEALGMLEQHMPLDLVLLDINMPILDGIGTLKKIRANPVYKEMKIIMVTSESEKTKVMEAISAGANDYLVKPFTPENLMKKLGLA